MDDLEHTDCSPLACVTLTELERVTAIEALELLAFTAEHDRDGATAYHARRTLAILCLSLLDAKPVA